VVISLLKSCICSSTMHICVVVRGEITNKIYQAWENNIPRKFAGTTISSVYSSDSDVVVCGKSCSAETLKTWIKPSLELSTGTRIVRSGWVVSSLKSGKLLPLEEYTHPTLDANANSWFTPSPSVDPAPASSTLRSDIPENSESEEGDGLDQTTRTALSSEAPSQAVLHDADETNRNKHITEILDELQAMYLQMGDQFRAQNYKKSSNQLKRMRHIKSSKELEGMTGFGKSLKTTIQEILDTGTLRKLSHLKKNPRSTAITTLSDIWGVGERTAEQLYNQGYETIEDLRTRGKHLLNRQQLIGLKHYEDILTKMPRSEVEEIASIVEEEMKRYAVTVE
jgi:hypothetical protein